MIITSINNKHTHIHTDTHNDTQTHRHRQTTEPTSAPAAPLYAHGLTSAQRMGVSQANLQDKTTTDKTRQRKTETHTQTHTHTCMSRATGHTQGCRPCCKDATVFLNFNVLWILNVRLEIRTFDQIFRLPPNFSDVPFY